MEKREDTIADVNAKAAEIELTEVEIEALADFFLLLDRYAREHDAERERTRER